MPPAALLLRVRDGLPAIDRRKRDGIDYRRTARARLDRLRGRRMEVEEVLRSGEWRGANTPMALRPAGRP